MRNPGKLIPEVARNRAELARMYRDARRDNPRVARLLFKRAKSAEIEFRKIFNERLFVTTLERDQVDGLARLMSE
jgi:hypothetical protein